MKNIIISLLLTLAFGLLSSGCSKEASVEGALSQADEYAADERFAEAEIEYKNALQKDPQNARAIAGLGAVYFDQGRIREAARYLRAAKDLLPNDLENRVRLAKIFLAVGQTENALQELQFVLEQNPAHPEAPLLAAEAVRSPEEAVAARNRLANLPDSASKAVALAVLEMKAQNLTAAKEHIDQAFQQDDDYYAAYSALSQWHALQRNEEEAINAFQQAAANAPDRSGVPIRYAQILQQQGKPQEAAAQLDKVLEAAPDYIPALAQRADLAARTNDPKTAKQLLERILRLEPDNPTAMRLQGALNVSSGKSEKGIEELRRAVERYPNDVQARYQLAVALLGKNQPQQAKPHLQAVVNAVPNHLEGTVMLADILLQESDVSGAVILLKNLVERRPDSPQAKLALAEAYKRQQNYADAHAIYRSIDQANPGNAQIDYLQGMLYLEQNQGTPAVAAFEAALQDDPNHLPSIDRLTALNIAQGKPDDALARLEPLIEASPDNGNLRVLRAQALAAKGDMAAAEAALDEAIAIDPANREAYIMLSRLYFDQGKTQEGLAELQSVIDKNPQDVGALTLMATIHDQAGDTEKSLPLYEQILEADDSFLPALNNVAYLYSKDPARLDEAQRLAERARQVAPNNAYTADTLGWILYKQGRYPWALSLLQESATQLSQHPEVLYHLGATQYMLGDEASAKAALTTAATAEADFEGRDDAQRKLEILEIDPANATSEDRQLLEKAVQESDKDAVAYTRLAQLQLQEGNLDEAEESFRAALEASPENANAKIGLARAMVERGQVSQAMELAREARRSAPNNPQVAQTQAEVAYLAGDHQWAMSLYTDIVRQQPANDQAKAGLAQALLANGRVQDALATASNAGDAVDSATFEALRFISGESSDYSAPDEADSLAARLASALKAEQNGNSEQAQEQFAAIVEDFPNQAQSMLGLGRMIADNPDRASELYQLASDARRLLPNSNEARALQAIARYHQSQYSDANRLFDSASPNSWSSPMWHYYYALTAVETGDLELAAQQKQAALSAGLSQEKAAEIDAAMEAAAAEAAG